MARQTRMDRLIGVLGGEQNLPVPIPQFQPVSETAGETGPAPDEQLEDHHPAIESVKELPRDDWWNRPPQPPQERPATTPSAPPIPTEDDARMSWDPRKGEAAPLGLKFTPFLAVTRFCYTFVRQGFVQPVASAIFDEGKIWTRGWDVYYVFSDQFSSGKPVTFVPEQQLLALVKDINKQFPKANVVITEDIREEGLVINFDDYRQELRPRWLGHCSSKAQHDFWTSNLPDPVDVGYVMPGEDRSVDAWREEMEKAVNLSKAKRQRKKDHKQTQRLAERQLKALGNVRVQKYLGLRESKDEENLNPNTTAAVDVAKPVEHVFDLDVIFIAVDVEMYEKHPRVITEIGIATLDTRDLRGKAPGRVGEDWQKAIRARHFLVKDYSHLINSEYVTGCPGNFEFGKTEDVPKADVMEKVNSCFKQPFSKAEGTPTDDESRNIILVGHDIKNDIRELATVGINIGQRAGIKECVDTAEMYRAYTRDPNARMLGSILYDFDLVGWHLHNAGNDAVYTLWAMLAIAVQSVVEKGTGEGEQRLAENVESRTKEAVERVKDAFKDEVEEWESPEDEGGTPIPLGKGKRRLSQSVVPKNSGGLGDDLYTSGGVRLDV